MGESGAAQMQTYRQSLAIATGWKQTRSRLEIFPQSAEKYPAAGWKGPPQPVGKRSAVGWNFSRSRLEINLHQHLCCESVAFSQSS